MTPDRQKPIRIVSWWYLQDTEIILAAILDALPIPGANVIKLFTMVIYHHSMVILSICVIKLYYPENYSGMAVNYHGIVTIEKVGWEVLR